MVKHTHKKYILHYNLKPHIHKTEFHKMILKLLSVHYAILYFVLFLFLF